MNDTAPQPLAAIASWHAHIYFRDDVEREAALRLRAQIAERFAVALGRVHDRPVGPHPTPMYQVAFDVASFDRVVPWLMLNRRGLAVFVHPNTRDERRDHLVHALWMGEVLAIDGSGLATDHEPEAALPPNTAPTVAA